MKTLLRSEIAGRLMLVAGTIGFLASVAGGVVAWRLLGDLERGMEASLVLTEQSLTTLGRTLEVAHGGVDRLREGLGVLEDTTGGIGGSLEEADPVLDEIARISGEDLPDTLEAVHQSMPALIRVAGGVDEALSTLGSLGIAEPPEEPMSEALRQIELNLEGLPERLRSQAALLEEAADDVGEVRRDVARVSASLAEIEESLAETESLLDVYAEATGDARSLIDGTRRDLGREADLARGLVVVLSGAIALGQVVPLYLGWELLGRP